MDKSLLRQVQLSQLEIAKEIKRVCEENGIRYFLAYGTLLGAVRHGGFIPWDDDLDMAMLRDDYERFCRIAPKVLQEPFYLQTWDLDENYPNVFAKVRKRGTVYVEAVTRRCKTGNELYVDVFPLDAYEEKGFGWKRLKIRVMKLVLYMAADYLLWEREKTGIRRVFMKLKYTPFMVLAKLLNPQRLKDAYQKTVTSSNNKQTNTVVVAGDAIYGCKPMPRSFFEQTESIQFEGITFSAPADMDGFLKLQYGDYMKLPPEDQRENRHGIIEVKL